MAIQINYQTSMGFIASEAYLKILNFKGDKGSIRVHYEIFYNSAAVVNQQNAIGNGQADLVLQNGATLQQMYDALKLTPEFTGAIDC